MAKQEDNDAKPASNAAASGSDEKQTQASATQSPTSGAASTQATSSKTTEAGVTTADGIELLKADHRKVEALFKDYEKAAPARKTAIIREACAELIAHTRLEEEIFYPACREAASDDEPLNEAQVEHDGAKVLIADLLASDEDDPYRDAKFKVLSEQIKHHVAEEEKPGSGIFAKARAAGVDVEALGRELRQRKEALTARGGRPRPTPLVALEISDFSQGQQQEDPMAVATATIRAASPATIGAGLAVGTTRIAATGRVDVTTTMGVAGTATRRGIPKPRVVAGPRVGAASPAASATTTIAAVIARAPTNATVTSTDAS